MASSRYQIQKFRQIDALTISEDEKTMLRKDIEAKTCLCEHLGNVALIALGISKEDNSPQALCPGQNIAWFNRLYTLQEMVDHIYGRCQSLVPAERPHMFAQEIVMYVDYFQQQVERSDCSPKEVKRLGEFRDNLEDGMRLCVSIAQKQPFEEENLLSIIPVVEKQRKRLEEIFSRIADKRKFQVDEAKATVKFEKITGVKDREISKNSGISAAH